MLRSVILASLDTLAPLCNMRMLSLYPNAPVKSKHPHRDKINIGKRALKLVRIAQKLFISLGIFRAQMEKGLTLENRLLDFQIIM